MMGKILDLLKNAAGQKGLHDSIGRWRQAVSSVLDSGAAAPQFAYGKGVAAQAGVAVNTDLDFEGIGLVNGIPRSVGSPNDSWVLTPGNVYLLTGFGFFDTFSDAAAGSMRVQWVDDANAALQSGTVDSPGMFFTPGTHAGARSTAAGIQMLYLAGATDTLRTVKLRVTAATGTATKPASSWSASLIQIPNA